MTITLSIKNLSQLALAQRLQLTVDRAAKIPTFCLWKKNKLFKTFTCQEEVADYLVR